MYTITHKNDTIKTESVNMAQAAIRLYSGGIEVSRDKLKTSSAMTLSNDTVIRWHYDKPLTGADILKLQEYLNTDKVCTEFLANRISQWCALHDFSIHESKKLISRFKHEVSYK